MRRLKEQKGITLIALIITIIVLLILAVVAISAVQNDGIIQYAKNARGEYEKAGVNENSTLQNYLDMIKENVPTGEGVGTGTDNGHVTEKEEEKITFYIMYREYQADKNQTWESWINNLEPMHEFGVDSDGAVTYQGDVYIMLDEKNVRGEDEIIPGCNYSLMY